MCSQKMEIIYHRMSHNPPIHQADSVALHRILVPSCLTVHLNVKKRDLPKNMLGCVSCAGSDMMSAVRLIYTRREFQPGRRIFLLLGSPLCFLKFPCSSTHPLWVFAQRGSCLPSPTASSCCGKPVPHSELVERHPGKVCDRREEHSSLP